MIITSEESSGIKKLTPNKIVVVPNKAEFTLLGTVTFEAIFLVVPSVP